MKHYSFPKIGQYRDFLRDIRHHFLYNGSDEATGEPVYKPSSELPVITIEGSIKLHGTNAGFVYDGGGGYYAMSKNNVITVDNDNAGFAQFVQDRGDLLKDLCKEVIRKEQDRDPDFEFAPDDSIILYGEWAGGNIQSKVALSELPKTFYIFAVRLVRNQEPSRWLKVFDVFCGNYINKAGIHNIMDFPIFTLKLDLKAPEHLIPTMTEFTELVEKCCPVASQLGVDGIGEGVVWNYEENGKIWRFKTKGEKHAGGSKPKMLPKVDIEKLNTIQEFVELVVSHSRVEQGMKETGADHKSKTPDVLRWVANDIISEEADTLVGNNLEWKEVAKYVANKTREIYFEKINKII